jgi:hypothetical protein
MKYISGIHALNLPCELNTTGDWHTSGIQWEHPHMRDTETSFFKEWGIERHHRIPRHTVKFAVANHLRACLDMLEEQDFSNLKGMYHDYLGNDDYLSLFFEKVSQMQKLPIWKQIDNFMEHEFKMKWLRYRRQIPNEKTRKMAISSS